MEVYGKSGELYTRVVKGKPVGDWKSGLSADGGTGFSEWDYEKAFEYFDAMLSRAENNTEENDGQVMAEAQYMSGAALVLLDRAEEGKERIEKAVMFYDAYDRSEFYRDAAMAHAFLAMAYGYLEPPGKQELLEQGELALSYFTQLETVDSEDIECIWGIQFILQRGHAEAFSVEKGREFKVWFDDISRLNGAKYID